MRPPPPSHRKGFVIRGAPPLEPIIPRELPAREPPPRAPGPTREPPPMDEPPPREPPPMDEAPPALRAVPARAREPMLLAVLRPRPDGASCA